MDHIEQGRVTALLKAWVNGSDEAHSELIPLVYDELHRLAHYYRRQGGAPGNTMQTTALVHEAYLRLIKIDGVDWNDRAHFFAVAAQLMRRILIDAVRAAGAAKRGGNEVRVDHLALEEIPSPDTERGAEILAVDEALNQLADVDPRRARVVEMRVFGGLTHDEIAAVLHISPQSVMRDWRLAKAWMLRQLKAG